MDSTTRSKYAGNIVRLTYAGSIASTKYVSSSARICIGTIACRKYLGSTARICVGSTTRIGLGSIARRKYVGSAAWRKYVGIEFNLAIEHLINTSPEYLACKPASKCKSIDG